VYRFSLVNMARDEANSTGDSVRVGVGKRVKTAGDGAREFGSKKVFRSG